MARLTAEDREERENLVLADFHTGYFSQRELSKKYKVSTATINKITKGLEPKNKDKVNAIVKARTELNTQSEQEVNAVNTVVVEQTRRANLVYGATEKILQLSSDMAKKNKKQIVMKVKEYSKENGSSESLDMIEVGLDANDLKNLADTVDKASITLGVNQRHANSQVTVNTQVNQTTQIKTIDDLYEDT